VRQTTIAGGFWPRLADPPGHCEPVVVTGWSISKGKPYISIHIHSSIENLIELNPHRKVLIDSLTEQIDGEITTVNKHEYTIDFTPLVISPILESRQLFN
jgi:hypothetical protein